MINSKKMSKSTIAIILLSLLLCLSLVLTATGAWFTDTVSDSDDQSGLSFGNIDIAATATVTEFSSVALLPGDSTKISGSVTSQAGSEAMYVFISVGTTGVELYVDAAHTNPAFDYVFSATGEAEGWTEIAENVLCGGKTGTLYYVAAAVAESTMTLEGQITFDSDTANEAYNGSGTAVRLNVDAAQSVTIGCELSASAVQARNLTASGNATLVEDEQATIVAALEAAVAATAA